MVGTIRRQRECGMRYGDPVSRTRDARERVLPTDHSPAALYRDADSTREYQRDSSSKRPTLSVVLVSPVAERPAATPKGGRQETTYRLT